MEAKLEALLKADRLRWRALGLVAALGVPSACIGGGFIRNLVWDHLHGRVNDCRGHDLDVLWHDPDQCDPEADRQLEMTLQAWAPEFDWSVKNQARMHLKNGDAPYASIADAMRSWPETATAVAVRRLEDGCDFIAPFGFDDLAGMVIRPSSSLPRKLEVFSARLVEKDWAGHWPKVTIVKPLR